MPPPPIPTRDEVKPPAIPDHGSSKRRPAGAVATAMVSGRPQQGYGLHSSSATGSIGEEHNRDNNNNNNDESNNELLKEQTHANNPYDLKAEPGSTVTASYPFVGEEGLEQLSFAVSPTSKTNPRGFLSNSLPSYSSCSPACCSTVYV